ncbi:hypothetical protein, variant 2 [Exophiala oligosperma]|uniref:Zn(2)-C6 fungal-type domain-containing protein n=1 Tax=Exophiala oligosperma TaxID=215243 RepID=A0A0D2AHW4_9EURO|nr:hypothetical protein, variant 2 [Exophiala oligosperma]KIW39741.1 hypothetical protein, variant 2 [Exophiala oligosperma]
MHAMSGCNTCRARRMKCDESKPSCLRCRDRGVECGGYSRELKWKLVGDQPKEERRSDKRRSQGPEALSAEGVSRPFYKDATPSDPTTTLPMQPDRSLRVETTGINSTPPILREALWPLLQHGQLFDFTNVDFDIDFFVGDENVEFHVPTNLGSLANTPSGQLSEHVAHHALPSTTTADSDMDISKSPSFVDSIFSTGYRPKDLVDIPHDGVRIPGPPDFLHSAAESAPGQQNPQPEKPDARSVLSKQPVSLSDTPDKVKHLFDDQLCAVLSIKDDHTTHPWRVHVWPLADNCPTLYHALAAMTYLFLSNSQPQLRATGWSHSQASLQGFAESEGKAGLSLEQSLAARLALAFAEGWDFESNSLGIEHVRIAGQLVRDAFHKHKATNLTGDDLDRLNFLVRTWMYKDVMTRLTISHGGGPVEVDFMTAYIELDSLPLEHQLDPLLGCAITLFPLIGRLTDIIRAVRRRSEKHNSPSIISRAAELRMAIEGWSPSFDPRRAGGLTPHVADAIQTAEAYRWTALLLLRQAIPELPWVNSFWEIAEKVSIYLATVPATSPTMIVHPFPFMAIGGEAFDEEDRDWICQRWDHMYKRMPLATLDKCKRVCQEVWRRRDAFEAQFGVCPSCGAYRLGSSGIDPTTDASTAAGGSAASWDEGEEAGRRCRCGSTSKIASPVSDFPDSLAFKKGVDNITRAGNLAYTVRGNLHWLGVLKEWEWDGEFLEPRRISFSFTLLSLVMTALTGYSHARVKATMTRLGLIE